jgi:two-component system chemotaxis sensor kinase CheA
LGPADRPIAFEIEGLIDIQDVVTMPFPAPWARVRHFSGATILGTGTVVPILNAAELVRAAAHLPLQEPAPVQEPDVHVPVILVAEDSITTRTLERTILESAGYEVRTAVDGDEAWQKLQAEKFALLVADVQMPGVDGFALTKLIREDRELRDLPVVLVTSLESRADQERGVEVGADAYLVKGSFEQEHLLDVVRRLV